MAGLDILRSDRIQLPVQHVPSGVEFGNALHRGHDAHRIDAAEGSFYRLLTLAVQQPVS